MQKVVISKWNNFCEPDTKRLGALH